jgi:hypothetical protein
MPRSGKACAATANHPVVDFGDLLDRLRRELRDGRRGGWRADSVSVASSTNSAVTSAR